MSSLSMAEASHLARRAGFSAHSKYVEALLSADSKAAAVEMMLNQSGSLLALPDWHAESPFGRTQDEEQRKQNQKTRNAWGRELKHWWFRQMVDNASPLQEKMTLFWANHFTSSLKKVKWPPALLAQNQLLRSHATGSFRSMLEGILRDPAMLLYLDNANSHKESPNENLARELLELFTMGEGQYSETDIKELARTLTGASVDRRTGLYRFRRRMHDTASKTIFGMTGNFNPDDIPDIILAQPQVASFITEKLWQFFIDDSPSQADIEAIAKQFADSDYNLSILLQGLFNSEAFWGSVGTQIKSPMELLVGCTQLFEIPVITERQFVRTSRAMNQDLFDPPHVKGWAEGKAWYNTSTVAVREKVTRYVARKSEAVPAIEQILAVDSVSVLPDEDATDFLQFALNDPAFQVV